MTIIKFTLVFVYNAESGIFNALADLAHKVLSPKTYSCNLCALTYSHVGMRKEWKRFLRNLNTSVEFLHRDELKKRYRIDDVPLPAIFTREGDELSLWIDARAIKECETLNDLRQLMLSKL